MSVSDAILLGEAWISEHYFTTDANSQSFRAKVLERRKTWDAEAAEKRPTPRSRFTELRQELEADLAKLAELTDVEADLGATDPRTVSDAVASIYERVIGVLELRGHGLRVDEDGPMLHVSAPGITDRAPLTVVRALPVQAVEDVIAKDSRTLAEPVQLDEDGNELTSAARLVSALFVQDTAPDLILILAGRWTVLAERERWAEGRYLAVDLQLICERNDTKRGGEIDRALTCLCAESIAPDAEGNLWWSGVLEESIKHTVGVSKDLRDGVRLSIEIIANEVVRRRAAQGLDPLPADQAQPLAKQALRFLYRILFLLYAEASPELGVLPIGALEYDQGYSLDRLRELVQVELATPHARSGRHLYESLGVLFRLVDQGHQPPIEDDEAVTAAGLTFNPLRADLFRPSATAHIDAVGLGNAALQEVLTHLLLSKEQQGRDRGFISYAELGINQLGAVYEGLMSYTGFFAETDLYEVAKGGDSSKGSWVVPVDRADGIDANDFVRVPDKVTGELRPVLHKQGSFVFRLAGRERQQSASYYTPEVLTRFTVGQALEELLDQDGETTSAADILKLTICEPALGSGAFAIEAVRQLADQYLKRREKELGRKIDPEDYPWCLQEVKAYLALHNVYGVDLNATAVELAEISLWLDTMVQGLSAPWFGLHLRRGNSLIGARRAVYRRSQVTDKSWLGAVPQEAPLTSLVEDIDAGRVPTDGIHHFLLPADGWGSAADAKEAVALAPDAAKKLKAWRSTTKSKPTKQTVDAYAELAHRVETLWQVAYRRLDLAEQQIRRRIPVWEAGELPVGGAVQREQIERALADEEGAYRRLRRVMDAWTALWFWPLTDATATVDGEVVTPPTVAQWVAGLQALLGRNPELRKRQASGPTLSSAMSWDELDEAERIEIGFAGAKPIETVLNEHPWLVVCERIAQRQGFFHWNLDFGPVFARGGFDLQVGNPPWVRPTLDMDSLLAEGDPWWQLALKPTQVQVADKRAATLALPGLVGSVVDGAVEVLSIAAFVGSVGQYPHLQRLQPDLYRCFMEIVWRHQRSSGISSLIHLTTHFTDDRGGVLRAASYGRLRRLWNFVNELKLFDIQHQKTYGVNVYGAPNSAPKFRTASTIYHPDTVLRSLVHDGSGSEPGLKDSNDDWDQRPHQSRIFLVNDRILRSWHQILESGSGPFRQTRMFFAVNRSISEVIAKIANAPKVSELAPSFSPGWHQNGARTRGFLELEWGVPENSADAIIQGSHLFVGSSIHQVPNRTMLHQTDWSLVDLEAIPASWLPATTYRRACDQEAFDTSFSNWHDGNSVVPARKFFRIAWRNMTANNIGVRTLMPALIPPGFSHVHSVTSMGFPHLSFDVLVATAGALSSLVADFSIRSVPKSTISGMTLGRLPRVCGPLESLLALRVLRLNALTEDYADLWKACYREEFTQDCWSSNPDFNEWPRLEQVEPHWNLALPLRREAERRQAFLEIDVIVALSTGLTEQELRTLYRTQFPVLNERDRKSYYDRNGRLVPNAVLTVWRKKGDRITAEERTATNQAGNTYTYELPFETLDREVDMRQAYAHFERILQERS